MGYYMDLTTMSLDRYKERLETGDLLPSRMMLRDGIDEHFDAIKKQKIGNVDELYHALKTKKKFKEFLRASAVPEAYLAMVLRDIKGFLQKPNKIADFPTVDPETTRALEGVGIKNTLQLYERVITDTDRRALARETGIEETEILRLAHLADLSRIKWVNHTFAYVLLEAGYDSARSVAQADYHKLYEEVRRLNREREIYKGNIGAHDMKLCVEAARDLDDEIAW